MLILVLFLLLIAMVHTTLSLSLYENKVIQAAIAAGLALSALVLLPLSIKVNTLSLIEQLQRREVIQTICTYQIIESLMVMILTVRVMKNHFEHRDQKGKGSLVHFPNGLTLGLIFITTNGLCHVLHQWSYWMVAGVTSVLTAAVLVGGMYGLQVAVKNWLSRLELKIIINFLQIILAMFLPLMLSQMEVRRSAFEVEWLKSSMVLTAMLAVTALGWAGHKLNLANRFVKAGQRQP